MDLRVVFMGSPDFALPTLGALADAFDVIGVVTQPDRPAGRGHKLRPPEVKTLAIKLGLPVIQPPSLKDPQTIAELRKMAPDVIVVAAFGQILRPDVLALPRHGCVNVHASLLPRWRGAAPVQAAVLHDDVTGVTIMKMDRGLDTGPILSQRAVPIRDTVTAGELFDELAQLGAELLIETLPRYVSGEIRPRPQDDAEATYAPRLSTADGELDFNQPADFLARMVRAYNPWPGTFSNVDGVRLKVFQAHSVQKMDVIPAKRYIIDEQPAWGTADGVLVLDEVQAAGKERMPGRDFLRGVRDWTEFEEKIEPE
jgi:methionyl-tRNA formyltransferase